MATITNAPALSGKRAGVRRAKRHSVKIDMTPMVDLGFLLISFFVITTELSKPKTLDLKMPHEEPPMSLGQSNALTLLLDKDNTAWYYQGEWPDAVAANRIFPTTFDINAGIGKVIRERRYYLDGASVHGNEGRNGLMLVIKPTKDASYKSVIDVLDEALIWSVKKYAIVDPAPEEIDYLRRQTRRK